MCEDELKIRVMLLRDNVSQIVYVGVGPQLNNLYLSGCMDVQPPCMIVLSRTDSDLCTQKSQYDYRSLFDCV